MLKVLRKRSRPDPTACVDECVCTTVSLQLGYVKFPQTYIDRMLAAAVQIQSNQAEESRQVRLSLVFGVYGKGA